MTQRDWNVALALGFSLGLLSGCTHARTGMVSGSGQPKPRAPAPLLAAQTASGPSVSPYHILPLPSASAPADGPASAADAANPAGGSGANGTPSEPQLQRVNHLPTDPSKEPVLQPQRARTPEATAEQPLTVRPDVEPNLPEPAVITALRYLLDKRPADAMRFLKSYEQPNQDLLFCVLPLAERLSGESLDRADPNELAIWVDQLEGVIGPMRRRAALGLDRMCFCKRIERYGVYEPLPEDHAFRPGDTVQLYVELRNLSSELRDALYETRLASSVRLTRVVDGKEQIEWEQGFPDRYQSDRSQTRRHDYFNNYRFSIPANLPLGTYTLHLRVVDVPTGRAAERALPLRLTTRPGT